MLEGVLPNAAAVPLVEMLRRTTNRKMRLVFNAYPPDRGDTHRGSKQMDDARLMKVYHPPFLPLTERLDEFGAWRAVGDLGAEVARRLTIAAGLLYPAPGDVTHLRTSGWCGVQPAHTDAWEPWLVHGSLPSMSLIIALEDNTRVTVYPGSHRLFRRYGHAKVSRSEAGKPVIVTLRKGSALLLRQDLIHHGMEATKEEDPRGGMCPVQNDRLFMYIYQGQMSVKNRTCIVEWVER